MKTTKKNNENRVKKEMEKLTKRHLKTIKGGDGAALPINGDFD